MLPLLLSALASSSGGKGKGAGSDGLSTSIKYVLIAVGVAVASFFGWRAYKNYQDKKTAQENNDIDTKGITAQNIIDYNNKVKDAKKLTATQLEAFNNSYGKVFANQLRSAFNPSGYSWLISTDTTNTPEVLAIASRIKQLSIPFRVVANAYYTAYNDDLNIRLQKELSPSELKTFYSQSGLQGIQRAAIVYKNLPVSGIANARI